MVFIISLVDKKTNDYENDKIIYGNSIIRASFIYLLQEGLYMHMHYGGGRWFCKRNPQH